MSSPPIACTLSAPDLAAVKERYRTAADHYRATARLIDTSATITLTGDRTFLRSLLDEMVERESRCCAFLTFNITESSAGFEVILRTSNESELTPHVLRESVATLFPTAGVRR